jgi:hypothetical protein
MPEVGRHFESRWGLEMNRLAIVGAGLLSIAGFAGTASAAAFFTPTVSSRMSTWVLSASVTASVVPSLRNIDFSQG